MAHEINVRNPQKACPGHDSWAKESMVAVNTHSAKGRSPHGTPLSMQQSTSGDTALKA